MPDFEGYERYKREREEWYVRGRLRLYYMGGRMRALEEILAKAELIEEEKNRMILRARLDDHDYELRVYRQGGFLRRSKPLNQLEFATRVVGAGLDVSSIDAACVAGGHVVIFQDDAEDWIDPALYITSSKVKAASKQKFLIALARYCRRLHDAGFYQPAFTLSSVRARVLPQRMEFRLHDIDGADVRDVDDDDRFEMLGTAWQKTPLPVRYALRFLRAYLKEGEDARKIGLVIWHYYGRKVLREQDKKQAKEPVGRFILEPFEVLYLRDETDASEIQKLYRAGLKSAALRIVRSPDALTLWKRALREADDSPPPIACFVNRKQGTGFILFREKSDARNHKADA